MALNSTIVIRQRAAGADALGQPSGGWQTVTTLWGEIRHPSGIEQARAGGEVTTIAASIKVRRRAGITPDMQAVHGSTVYDIQAVLPDEVDRLYMFLVCQAVQ